ncbi:MAG: hypothetical protein JWP81_3198 [Ferruginibacter sp.]|nr:hypothetical protein [Ferruginibacter sp.]
MEWIIGCSGFSYKSWKPLFYPTHLPSTKWFEFYCEHFNTVELNVTFYRFPRAKTFATWYRRSPAGFTFSVKAPRLITHYKQLLKSKEQLTDFYEACTKGLAEKLGPILFQFPSRFSYTEERLQRILDNLDPSFVNVVEFRHDSWWNEEVYTLLAKHRIIFCGMSHPDLPDAVAGKGKMVYYRFHGVPDLYSSLYSDAEMERIAKSIADVKGIKKAWCYFNNDINTAAIKNAKWLQEFGK